MRSFSRGPVTTAARCALGFACLLAPIVGACTKVDKHLVARPPPGFAIHVDYEQPTVRIVYVVDCSGSMTDAFGNVKYLLIRSIAELDSEHDFHVIFFSSGPPLEMPRRRLITATDRNKYAACEFIDSVIAEGGTDPTEALKRAFEVQPDIIYFLSDGDYDVDGLIAIGRNLNAQHKVILRAIAFLDPVGGEELKRLATANGGEYMFVSEAYLKNRGDFIIFAQELRR